MLTKILIADASEEFCLALTEELGRTHTVRACVTGQEALAQLRTYRPDFLIIDLMLCGSDGLTVLQQARQENLCPPFLVSSTYYPAYALRLLEQLEPAYMVRKPCDLSALVSRIEDLIQTVSQPVFLNPSSHCVVTSMLLELGLSARRKGFRCIREAVLMLVEDPGLQVTKEVYPRLAKIFETQAFAVEKNIRDSIYDGWRYRDESVWRKYFPMAPNAQVARPSNSAFLRLLAEQVGQVRRMAR